LMSEPWLREEIEAKAMSVAISEIVPRHLSEVRDRRENLVRRTMVAVKDRLTKEITYWDHRAQELLLREQAGKTNSRLNSSLARRRADDLEQRLQRRMSELEQERQIKALPPNVVGGVLVVPAGLLSGLQGAPDDWSVDARTRREVELMAMEAVMAAERQLGFAPRDVSDQNLGWDVESILPETGALRFIEVKGRTTGATTVTITRNEILAGLNKPDDYYLAVVLVNGVAQEPVYVQRPFQTEPDFHVTSVNYDLQELLAQGHSPLALDSNP
jgi:hypothetical protein